MGINSKLPIVLGITGASGFVYGLVLLEFLIENGHQIKLIVSTNAYEVAKHELAIDLNPDQILNQLSANWQRPKIHEQVQILDEKNFAASVSSGSYQTNGMIIAPCSMGTIANIAAGTSNNLITRAADVCLKERRRLVLVARETPLNTIHLRNMLSLSEMGAVILPAAPGFYHKPKNIDDQINFIVGKTLDAFGIDNALFTRWATSRSVIAS